VALVADAAGRIVGWIHALDRVLLQWKRVLEIGGLVIDQDRRGEGIGAGLVDAVAEWAQLHGHTTLFVRSNVVREGAHDFYPALGFAHWKTSHTYVKEL
jgi:GNAT superfamily N-acetyltransferase